MSEPGDGPSPETTNERPPNRKEERQRPADENRPPKDEADRPDGALDLDRAAEQEKVTDLYSDERRRQEDAERIRRQRRNRSLHGDAALDVDIARLISSGPAAIGPGGVATQINIGLADIIGRADRGPTAASLPFDLTELRHLRGLYVPTAHHGALVRGLEARRVVLLSGAPKTGRKAAAAVALAELCGDTALTEIHLPSGGLPTEGLCFDPGRGHVCVLRPPGPLQIEPADLARLQEQLTDVEAYSVFIVDRNALDHDLVETFVVRHDPPAPRFVVEAHLRVHCEPITLEKRLRDPRTDQAVAAGGGPAVLALLAERLGKAGDDPDAVDRAYTTTEEMLEKRVREQLREIGTAVGQDGGRSRAVAKAAFLVACAAFDGLMLTTVVAAASRLLSRLNGSGSAYAPSAHEAITARLDGFMDFADATTDVTLDGQVLRLRTPERAGAVFRVVWNEHPWMRRPLLVWLNDIVERLPRFVQHRSVQDARLQDNTAQVIGTLATFDFEHMMENIIGPWARSNRRLYAELAATALESVGGLSEFSSRVRSVIRRLIDLGANGQRTAILAYETNLGLQLGDEAIADLCELARRERHLANHRLDFALEPLLRERRVHEVVDVLAGWARSDVHALEVHAARMTVLIARWRTDRAWPRLLRLYADDPARRPVIERLLARALRDRAMTDVAAEELVAWIRAAEADRTMNEPMTELVTALVEDEGVRLRLAFHHCRIGRSSTSGSRIEKLLQGGEHVDSGVGAGAVP